MRTISLYPERVLPRTFAVRSAALLAALALGVAGLSAPVDAQSGHSAARTDPRKTRGLFVDTTMPAYQHGGVYRTRIGRYAQAFWVIPEAYDTAHVTERVQGYTGDAAAARKTPVLTIYGIPGRDCGQYSSGNPLTTASQYRAWIRRVAVGLRHQHALVVLEPDALALFSSSAQACQTKPDGWQGMLRFASRKLSATGAWVYLDAGHSNWTPYDTRPKFLKAAGIQYDRGFSTNVSNFRPTRAEKAYAAKMLAGLRRLGVRGKHFVVDTSRNGATPPEGSGYDVINPTWARLGNRPRLVFDGAFDGTLWVKHPGESDGEFNGGGPSGHWCDMLADRLIDGTSDHGSCPQ